MPRFVTQRDFEFIQHITRELIDETMDVGVVLYKIVVESTKINIYGEALNKTWHKGVELYCLISKQPESIDGRGRKAPAINFSGSLTACTDILLDEFCRASQF